MSPTQLENSMKKCLGFPYQRAVTVTGAECKSPKPAVKTYSPGVSVDQVNFPSRATIHIPDSMQTLIPGTYPYNASHNILLLNQVLVLFKFLNRRGAVIRKNNKVTLNRTV